MMYFIAHLDHYDADSPDISKSHIITVANTFSEAIDNIVEHFGEKWIERITLLEPITDNSVLYLPNNTVEKEIREHELNGFF